MLVLRALSTRGSGSPRASSCPSPAGIPDGMVSMLPGAVPLSDGVLRCEEGRVECLEDTWDDSTPLVVEGMVVTWPDGSTSTFEPFEARQVLDIDQSASQVGAD